MRADGRLALLGVDRLFLLRVILPSAARVHTIQSYLARRQDNFLLLRIVAALMVIYGHSFALAQADGSRDVFIQHGWPMYSGDIAVSMFFVISGFMVSGSYLVRHDLLEFAKSRLARIVPAYVLVLVVCAWLIGPLLTTLSIGDYFRDSSVSTYVFKNLRFSSDMAWHLPGVFEEQVRQAVNGSLWTLPAEMRMYVLTAALGAFGLLASRWVGTVVVCALLGLGMFHPEYLPLHNDWVRPAGFFALGILVQLHKDRIQVSHAAMVMLVFLTYLSMRTQSAKILFALCLVYFCFWFAYRTPTWRGLSRAGDPSYGIYLWGWPMQQVTAAYFPSFVPWQNFLLAALLATVMGVVSWWGLERRALLLKDWRPRWFRRLLASPKSFKGLP